MASRKKRVPSDKTLSIWRKRGKARATDGCLLPGLTGKCQHGKPSWFDLDGPRYALHPIPEEK